MVTDSDIEELLMDQSLSYWFKDALETALKRDPVDAERDAMLLLGILSSRLDSMQTKEALVPLL